MILEELELGNFRSHKNTRIRFDEGITVIVGDNGSGKTSILEAIGYALFRETPSRVRIDELVRRGGEKEGMRVSLVFNADGRKYKIIRSYVEGRSGAMLYDGEGRIISTGEKGRQTTKEIEKRVRMDSKLFTNAIYIRQGQIDALLTAEARERKELIGKLIGTQELEKAFVNMREILNDYELMAQRYLDVPEEIKETRSRIQKEQSEIKKLLMEVKRLDHRLRDVMVKKADKEKEGEILEKAINLNKELVMKKQELEASRRRLREIEENEKILRSTQSAKERYESLREEIRRLEEKITILKEIRRNLARIRRDIQNKERKMAQVEAVKERGLREGSSFLGKKINEPKTLEAELLKEIDRLEKKIERADTSIKELERRIGELKGKNKEMKEALEELLGAEERCPVCRRPLTKEHREKVIREYRESLRRNTEAIRQSIEEKKELENERQSCLERLRRARGINIEIIKNAAKDYNTLREEAIKLKDELREKDQEVRSITDLVETLRKKDEEKKSLRRDYERYIAAVGFLRKNAPEKEAIEKREEELLKIIQELRNEISSLGIAPDREKLESVRRDVKSLYDAAILLSNNKSAREAEARDKQKIIDELEKKLEGLRVKKEEAEKLEEFLQLLRKIRNLFHKDNLQKKLRARARPLIEKHAREEFQKFHLPYSDISLSEDFEITLYGPEGGVRMDMLSGGERIAAALALRIGIAKALAGSAMELLMLDEPTIHLDSTRRRELVEIIKNLTTLPQTIVVTHDKEFEGAADRLLEVEKTDGVSTVKEG